MKLAGLSFLFLSVAVLPLCGQEKKVDGQKDKIDGSKKEIESQDRSLRTRDIDKQLFDVLKEVHNRGADIFNNGDSVGCYRIFQGSLQTCRALLAHRPEDQKFIDEAMANADKEPSINRRAFVLHESIEKLRARLRETPGVKDGRIPEVLTAPREVKPAPKETEKPREVKPAPKTTEKGILPGAQPSQDKDKDPKKITVPKDGLMGHVFWNGKPLMGAQVIFVSRGALDIRVFESESNADGAYLIAEIRPGKYTVLITKTQENKPLLPQRYATTTTSPLIAEVKRGERLDFMLQ